MILLLRIVNLSVQFIIKLYPDKIIDFIPYLLKLNRSKQIISVNSR